MEKQEERQKTKDAQEADDMGNVSVDPGEKLVENDEFGQMVTHGDTIFLQ